MKFLIERRRPNLAHFIGVIAILWVVSTQDLRAQDFFIAKALPISELIS